LAQVARKTMFTHKDLTALAGGEFFARVTHRVINGATPSDAIAIVAGTDGWVYSLQSYASHRES